MRPVTGVGKRTHARVRSGAADGGDAPRRAQSGARFDMGRTRMCASGSSRIALLLAALIASSAAATEPFEYPRTVTSTAGTVTIHAPQILDWADFEKMTGLTAVEVTPAGAANPSFVNVGFRAHATLAPDSDIVRIEDLDLASMRRSDGSDLPEAEADLIRAAVPEGTRELPLDLVVSYLAEGAVPDDAVGIKDDPPEIIVTERDARLVLLVGEPVMVPVAEDAGADYAANTNWPLFRVDDRFYLLDNANWLTSAELDSGWQWADALPDALKRLPEPDDWRDTRAAAIAWKASPKDRPPEVFVREKPAELIAFDGAPALEPVADTGIEYATNTDAFVFRYDGAWYYLVSGRWFRAPSLNAGFAPVTELPAAFSRIPEDSPVGDVLASVPGTDEAKMAAIRAQIPNKMAIPRDVQLPVEVTYVGDPAFEPIEGVPSLARAANTPYDVVRLGSTYYLCYSGAWYRSAAPAGPWQLADEVPEQIYQIPPSSPIYNTTYVHVYESSPTTVTYGYSTGYHNVYVVNGVPVYGTGYYYPPYYYPWGYYPIYYPYPYSYGSASYYNPRTGTYGSVSRAYGPYGGWGYASAYNPERGTYARAEAVWDHDEWYAVGEAYNPRTGRYAETERYWNDKNDSWDIETSVDGPRGGADIHRTFDDDSGTFAYQTDRGGEGTIKRKRTDEGWQTSSKLELADGRTVEGSGSFDERGQGSATLRGSDGGTGTIERTVDGGTATREGSFSKDGKELSTTTSRSFDGSGPTRTVESSEGGSLVSTGRSGDKTYVGQSASGDVYAGRDGNVYKRTDDGWQKHDGSGWSSVDRDRSATAAYGSRTDRPAPMSGTQRQGGSGGDYRSSLNRDFQARQRASRSLGGMRQQRAGGGMRVRRR